jgi:hypothetical protein
MVKKTLQPSPLASGADVCSGDYERSDASHFNQKSSRHQLAPSIYVRRRIVSLPSTSQSPPMRRDLCLPFPPFVCHPSHVSQASACAQCYAFLTSKSSSTLKRRTRCRRLHKTPLLSHRRPSQVISSNLDLRLNHRTTHARRTGRRRRRRTRCMLRLTALLPPRTDRRHIRPHPLFLSLIRPRR